MNNGSKTLLNKQTKKSGLFQNDGRSIDQKSPLKNIGMAGRNMGNRGPGKVGDMLLHNDNSATFIGFSGFGL